MPNITNKLKLKIVLSVFFLLIFSLFFSCKADAATLSVLPNNATVSVGNIISVRVVTNTQGDSINNVESTVQFPSDLLEVVSVNKDSSIFSLWVEEPKFSNSAGTVTFNGGVANPGFNGSNGTLVSITFRAKKTGTASIIFSNSAIRKNDGLGTDITSGENSGTIQIGTPKKIEVPVVPPIINSDLPPKPLVYSGTHPNQDLWYASNTASFNWKIPNGVISIQTLLNKTANSTPTITYDNSVSQKTLTNLNDGTYYFHLRYLNSAGWGPVAHYKVKIDTMPPLAFVPTIRSVDFNNLITLDAEDATSGIDYYSIKIDNGTEIKVSTSELVNGEYTLPVEQEGSHDVVVTAYDKAQNHTVANATFLSSKIIAPVLTLSSYKINKGDTVTVLGKTEYPNQKVEITLQVNPTGMLGGVVGLFNSSNGNIKTYTETTAQDGTFSFTTDPINTAGVVSVKAVIVFSSGVRSQSSEAISSKVNDTKVVSTISALIYPILGVMLIVVLLLIILFIIYIGWHRFFNLRKKIRNELQNTTKDVHKAMLLLKDELNNQLEILERIKSDRVLNKKEEAVFDEIQKNIDDIDNFIEKKLKKML